MRLWVSALLALGCGAAGPEAPKMKTPAIGPPPPITGEPSSNPPVSLRVEGPAKVEPGTLELRVNVLRNQSMALELRVTLPKGVVLLEGLLSERIAAGGKRVETRLLKVKLATIPTEDLVVEVEGEGAKAQEVYRFGRSAPE